MLRIIIADDEFDIVELCRALITYPGAEIVGEACNGIELLKKIEELHPDVVITDICMPGMTGLEPVSYTHLYGRQITQIFAPSFKPGDIAYAS